MATLAELLGGTNQRTSSRRPISLSLPAPSSQQNFNFDFDPEYETARTGLERSRDQRLADLDLAGGRLDTDFQTNKGLLERAIQRRVEGIQGDYAGRGLLRSGMNLQSVGDANTDFLENLSQLTQGRQRGLEDITRQRTGLQGDVQSQLGQLQVERSRRQLEREDARSRQEAERFANERSSNEEQQRLQQQEQAYQNAQETYDSYVQSLQPKPSPTGQYPPRTPPPVSAPPRAAIQRRINRPAPKPPKRISTKRTSAASPQKRSLYGLNKPI